MWKIMDTCLVWSGCSVKRDPPVARKRLWDSLFLSAWNNSDPYSSFYYVALQLFYRVLAFSTNSLHLPLSWARVIQFGTFNFRISFLTSSTQRVFGLPIGLLEMGFQEYIAFTTLVPCILSMWPSPLSLCARMKFTMFLCFIISSNRIPLPGFSGNFVRGFFENVSRKFEFD